MLIDKLNIFKEIKENVHKFFNVEEVYAVGSRAKGISRQGKWDFDIALVTKERLNPKEVQLVLDQIFKDRKDENNKLIRIDVWTVIEEKKENFLNGIKLRSNAILL